MNWIVQVCGWFSILVVGISLLLFPFIADVKNRAVVSWFYIAMMVFLIYHMFIG